MHYLPYSENITMHSYKLISGFIQYLGERLAKDLPGLHAHRRMSPVLGGEHIRSFTPSATSRESAVLLLIHHEQNRKAEILLTLRSSTLNNHRGQISFPGGKCEPGETFTETALREAEEEVGIQRASVNVIGTLSKLFVPPSDNLITPVIAVSERIGTLNLNPDEVEEAFFVNLDKFFEDGILAREKWDFDGITVDVPLWKVHGRVPLWGATAMIMQELLSIYEDYLRALQIKIC